MKNEKLFAVLVDPDKVGAEKILSKETRFQNEKIDIFLVGGSLVNYTQSSALISALRENFKLPVYLFPGSPIQYNESADGLLFLSLISGRNADLLIGRHIEIAPSLKRSSLEILPTGYMLVNDGKTTSASYISNTIPIPSQKWDIALATAQAGELLGLQCIYMDAGSGAEQAIPLETIKKVADNIDIPLIIGGGIKTKKQRDEVWNAGADMIVVGTAFED